MRGLGLCLALVAMLCLSGCGSAEVPAFGTKLDAVPSPGFTLVDQRGDEVSLDALRGKAIALTFIYTNCPDVCLLTAQNLRAAYEAVPADVRDRVALVAVTVDPENDTPERLARFSADQGLAEIPTWYALTGDRATLQEVWDAYGIDPGTMLLRMAQKHVPGGDTPGEAPDPADTATLLNHTDAIYVIDPQGQQRAFGRSDADPAALSGILAALARS
jgi:protein SCO1/2